MTAPHVGTATPAIFRMILAMALLALGDAMLKMAALTLPPAQVMVTVTLASALGFALIVRRLGLPLFPPVFWTPVVLARSAAEAAAGFCMMSALAAIPLVTLTAITQSVPILVTLGAVFFLGEAVGTRRWIAVAIGMIGVLVILRPGAEPFSLGILAAVGAALSLAARDVFTRAAPKSIHVGQLAIWGIGAGIPSGIIWWMITGTAVVPGPQASLALFIAVASLMAGYWAITSSVRMAEVSLVVPFRYSRLPFGVILGMLLFGENLDLWTFVGAAIIVLAGIYILHRERKTPLS